MRPYAWLTIHITDFFKQVNPDYHLDPVSLIASDGDKCESYKDLWEENNIPFAHGIAISLLIKTKKYSHEVFDNSGNPIIDPGLWVVNNYNKFSQFLPK